MTGIFRKSSVLIFLLLILALPVSIWLFPSAGFAVGVTFFLLSFLAASTTVLVKNRRVYLQGETTRGVFVRNTSLDIFGILLAMVSAALLGSFIARIVTAQIDHWLARFMAGIAVGLLAGIGVGMLLNRLRRLAGMVSKK